MATDMLKKFCYPRGFYIYKIVQLKAIDSIVINITIPSDTWSNEALFQIKQLLSEIDKNQASSKQVYELWLQTKNNS
jgi:hypothetical protein